MAGNGVTGALFYLNNIVRSHPGVFTQLIPLTTGSKARRYSGRK